MANRDASGNNCCHERNGTESSNSDNVETNGEQNIASTLEDFIVENYELQRNEGRLDATADIDDDRTANFYKRALGESRRMRKEVEKSKLKLEELHSELGVENINAWRTEHATEVLLPEQAAKIEVAEDFYSQD